MLRERKEEGRYLICPSLLSADFACLTRELEEIKDADYLHLDIMDGHFVPNITFGPVLLKKIRPHWKKIFDVHLMVSEPEKWIKPFADAGADLLVFHQEATVHAHRLIQEIRSHGCSAGVAINPFTPAGSIEEILPHVDLVLVMTVNPGFGGQSYLAETEGKIKRIREMIEKSGREIRLQVDGGISRETIEAATIAGADVFVAGSAIFGATDREAEIQALRQLAASAGSQACGTVSI